MTNAASPALTLVASLVTAGQPGKTVDRMSVARSAPNRGRRYLSRRARQGVPSQGHQVFHGHGEILLDSQIRASASADKAGHDAGTFGTKVLLSLIQIAALADYP
jgi:hypothetical protein